MKLTLIATPIGHEDDITLRAIKHLENAEIIICEELKTARRRLSNWGIPPQAKDFHQLNEHSTTEDIEELLELCAKKDVALITDCGTPSFFDPGFKLVKLCTGNHIKVESLPGVSSMTALFPFLREKTEHFEVLGFPPRETSQRLDFFKKIKHMSHPVLLLDTPYRLKKTFEDLKSSVPRHQCVVGINLTCNSERVHYGTPQEILNQISDINKENFICMVYS